MILFPSFCIKIKSVEVIVLLIAVSLVLAIIFLFAFIWANKSGQFEDNQSPAVRILLNDEVELGTDSTQNINKNGSRKV